MKNCIAEKRKTRGLTQQQLASLLGVTRQTIISLENVDVVWYVTSPSNLSAPVMAAAEANEAEENTEAQSVIPEIETAPVTSLDNLSHTELKLEMN